METNLLTRDIAEQYLDELLEAEKNHDYKACCKRWESDIDESFPEEKFSAEVEDTLTSLGGYQSREYIGCEIVDESPKEYRKRYVWKTVWDKDHCVIVVGIHQLEGVVYLNEWMYHSGTKNLLTFLLNLKPGVPPENGGSHSLDKAVAERVLDEMQEAKQTSNYAAWIKRWEPNGTEEDSEEYFLSNIAGTNNALGDFVSREYIGNLSCKAEHGKMYFHVWLSQFEKDVAITHIGIYEKEGVVYLDEIWHSYGDDHVYMMLYNHQS